MKEKLITKSFERLLTKGLHRGFITYEELGKSLGKRGKSVENCDQTGIQPFLDAMPDVEVKTVGPTLNLGKKLLEKPTINLMD